MMNAIMAAARPSPRSSAGVFRVCKPDSSAMRLLLSMQILEARALAIPDYKDLQTLNVGHVLDAMNTDGE